MASGWALASGQHTLTTYLWLTGVTRVKHFSSFYVFLGGPLYKARWKLWARLIQCATQWVPAGEPLVLVCDDSTKKKAGRKIEGAAHYRNGAGTARQEYRTLWGLNFVWGILRLPLPGWPQYHVSVPMGWSLYLKEEQATRLNMPQRSRRALAREIIDFIANQLPGRAIRVLADGGYATKEFLRDLPNNVAVVSRLLVTGKLYERPQAPRRSQRGRRPSKGRLIGSPNTLARKRLGWHAHPHEAGAKAQTWQGLGQDQCRKVERIIGANTLRLVLAAARTLWFVEQTTHHHGIELCRYRPWYRHKVAPSQLDIVWACREALYEDGISPIPRFSPDLTQNRRELANALPRAA